MGLGVAHLVGRGEVFPLALAVEVAFFHEDRGDVGPTEHRTAGSRLFRSPTSVHVHFAFLKVKGFARISKQFKLR